MRANAAPDQWINNYKLFIIRYFYKLADEVIVNSYEFKSEVKKKFNIKSTVIYNPINKKKLLKLSKKKLHFPFFDNFKNGLKILNIGRLTLQKNQIDLLKIVNVLKNKIPVKLLIIGSGNQIEFLKSYVSEKRIKDIVKFLPYKKNPYVYFKKSNIFLLTSVYEGLPNVLLEATLFKNFCFSYQCRSGPKEILDKGKGGVLTNTRNYKKMASEIQKYYFNKSKKKYKQMIRTSFINLKKYNLQKQLKKYEKLIFIYLK